MRGVCQIEIECVACGFSVKISSPVYSSANNSPVIPAMIIVEFFAFMMFIKKSPRGAPNALGVNRRAHRHHHRGHEPAARACQGTSAPLGLWAGAIQLIARHAQDCQINAEFPLFTLALFQKAMAAGNGREEVSAVFKVLAGT